MTHRARLWTGVTLLVVLALNYVMLGVPLARRASTLQEKTRAILMKQVKAKGIFKGSEDEYILEIFRKERQELARKMLVLNTASTSLLIIIMSWMAFGLIVQRKK